MVNPDTPVQRGSSAPACRQRHVAWKHYVPVLLTLVVGVCLSFFLREKAINHQKHHFRQVLESITDNNSLLIVNSIKNRFQALEVMKSLRKYWFEIVQLPQVETHVAATQNATA